MGEKVSDDISVAGANELWRWEDEIENWEGKEGKEGWRREESESAL